MDEDWVGRVWCGITCKSQLVGEAVPDIKPRQQVGSYRFTQCYLKRP